MAKILLIEDDQFLIKMYKTKFELSNFEVETASDGATGLEKMKSFKPDLVFMDIMMPKLDGLEALDTIQADPELKKIPVVMLTNLSGGQDAETAIKKGAKKVLIKSELNPKDIVMEAQKMLQIS